MGKIPPARLGRLGGVLGLCILGVGAGLLWYERGSGPVDVGGKADGDAPALLRLPPGVQDDPVIAAALAELEADPSSAPAHGVLLDAALARGDLDSACEHSQKLLDIAPDADSHARAAQLLYLTGDLRKSTWMARKALELAPPGSSQAGACRAQLAMLYWRNGALLPAEQTVQAGLAQSPDHPGLLLAMGKVKAGRKDYPGAIECYRKAISRRPDPGALAELGDLLLASGQTVEAESLYREVEEDLRRRLSGDRQAGLETARFLSDHDRDLAQALRLAEEACKELKSVHALDTLAWCYYKNERYREAGETIERALQKRTPDASIFFHAGMISWKLGQRIPAQKRLYQALSLNSYFHPLHAEIAAETLKLLGAAPASPPEPSSAGSAGAALKG